MPHAVAILGGTFNPPHQGHIQCALDTLDQIKVERLGLMPCLVPPHKHTSGVEQHHRVNMIKQVCLSNPRLYPELIELTLPAPSYTVKTLEHLSAKYPNVPLLFLLGEDSLYNLDKWHQWERLTDYCHLVVMRRTVNDAAPSTTLNKWLLDKRCELETELFSQCSGRVYFANSELHDTSSSEIRRAIAQAKPVDKWVSRDVINYIHRHNLYNDQ